tara:strand:+ start:1051 stop:2283 length:1233 start_codon:yes stop_codon:yes gene_type:complete
MDCELKIDNLSVQSDSESDNESISSVSSDEIDNQVNNIDLKGDSINSYYIIEELGRGGSSIVWLAYNPFKNKFFAFKVNHPDDFKEAVSEAKFHKRLSSNKKPPLLFNKIIESFPKTLDGKRYYCSVYRLYCGNLDDFISKGYYPNGYDEKICINIIHQIVKSLDYLHNKLNVYHGDLKPDNILLQGLNNRDKTLMLSYKNHPSFSKIREEIDETKRSILHFEIVKSLNINKELKYECDDIFINKPNVVLSDFGNFCDIDDEFEDEFGTRYYRAPEVIMVTETGYPVDIWALGCSFYEILTGKYLFDPKRKTIDTNHEHLCMITNICGNISKKRVKMMKKQKRKNHFTKKWEIKENNNSHRKLNEILSDEIDNSNIIDFITGCLITNPNSRYTISELMKHNIFNPTNQLQ